MPPPSPWRTRAEQLRHRPVRLRQAALVLAGLAFLCTFALLSRQRQANYDDWPVADDHRTPQSLETSFPLQNGHDHRPHHGSGRPPQVADDHSLPSDSNLEDTHTNIIAAAPEPIVFSLIMFSEDAANEGAVLMKVCRHSFCRTAISDHISSCSPSLCTVASLFNSISYAMRARGRTSRNASD